MAYRMSFSMLKHYFAAFGGRGVDPDSAHNYIAIGHFGGVYCLRA
jgi:hypothetical protein